MSEKQELLQQEAKRIAAAMWKALGSTHPELIVDPSIHVGELFREIGHELFECANPIDDYDRAPAWGIFENVITGIVEASDIWDSQHMDAGDDGEPEYRARNTMLRLVTRDGERVE